MSQSSTHMLCSTFVSAKIRHGNLKTSVFNFCGSMLPGFADFNAKNNKKNLHDCNEYMNNDPDFDYASPILDFSIFRGQNRHFCPRLVSFEHQTKA